MLTTHEQQQPLLEMKHLHVDFDKQSGGVAVNDLSFAILEHEILAVVGESGSGTSV